MLSNGQRSTGRQVLYNMARVNTLVFIGGLSGAVGASIVHLGPVAVVERGLPILAGALMLVVGAEMLGLLGGLSVSRRLGLPSRATEILRTALRSRTLAAPIALGVFNAFLPCHLVYAFAARAASSGSVTGGMLTMLCFGLGTVPALLLAGHLGSRIPARLSPILARSSGIAVVVFGLWTIARAFLSGNVDHHQQHGM